MFLDERRSDDLRDVAVDDFRALAAQTYWHRVTGNFWEWAPDENDEELWLTGSLVEVEEVADSSWPQAKVMIRFQRAVSIPGSSGEGDNTTVIEAQVEFEVLTISPENFQVLVKQESLLGNWEGKKEGKKPPTAKTVKKLKGTVRYADILYGRSCLQSRRTAHNIAERTDGRHF